AAGIGILLPSVFSTFPYLHRSTLGCAAGRNPRAPLYATALRPCLLRGRDLPFVLMDDKSGKGKEKDGSASTPPNRRKAGLKFSPKVPTKKTPKRVPKMEPEEESELDPIDKDLLRKLRMPQSKGALERRFKAEKSDDCVQVAFGQVNSSTARSFPTRRSSSSVKQEQEVNLFSKYMMSGVTTSAAKLPKQFTGPQDFTHPSYNYPPITLPLRRPHSADPDFDEDEFGEFSSSRTQDGELTAAKELGLMVCISCCMISCRGTPFLLRYSYQCRKPCHMLMELSSFLWWDVDGTGTEDKMNTPQLLFFQFPASLPLPQVLSVAGADMDTSDSEGVETEETNKRRRLESVNGCKLKDLPGGLMGKLLVYKSGKVKMLLGDALFDVSAGLDCTFAQEAVAINTYKKHCCSLGEVNKRAIVTPDIDYLVDSIKRIG
uniref:DNA-directed RNA polymerase III subunit RPC4 n=1 Tax=Aegilops tauschii subsp. strangulata TaxID=200361 RepID=A0A453HCP2_AEGTS